MEEDKADHLYRALKVVDSGARKKQGLGFGLGSDEPAVAAQPAAAHEQQYTAPYKLGDKFAQPEDTSRERRRQRSRSPLRLVNSEGRPRREESGSRRLKHKFSSRSRSCGKYRSSRSSSPARRSPPHKHSRRRRTRSPGPRSSRRRHSRSPSWDGRRSKRSRHSRSPGHRGSRRRHSHSRSAEDRRRRRESSRNYKHEEQSTKRRRHGDSRERAAVPTPAVPEWKLLIEEYEDMTPAQRLQAQTRYRLDSHMAKATADEPWTRYSAAEQPAMGEAFESDDEDKSDGERALAREMRAAQAQRMAERGASAQGPAQQAQEEAHESEVPAHRRRSTGRSRVARLSDLSRGGDATIQERLCLEAAIFGGEAASAHAQPDPSPAPPALAATLSVALEDLEDALDGATVVELPEEDCAPLSASAAEPPAEAIGAAAASVSWRERAAQIQAKRMQAATVGA